MTRIEVTPGYTVAPRFIDLEDGEVLCADCRGSGEITSVYVRIGNNHMMRCRNCAGLGKVAYCARCAVKRHIIEHKSAPWRNALCVACIIADPRLKDLS